MKYIVKYSRQFKKSYKLCKRRGYDMTLVERVIIILAQNGKLPDEYRAHKLSGNYAGLWECHIKPDWLLVGQQNDEDLILLLLDTGSHADLFGK